MINSKGTLSDSGLDDVNPLVNEKTQQQQYQQAQKSTHQERDLTEPKSLPITYSMNQPYAANTPQVERNYE